MIQQRTNNDSDNELEGFAASPQESQPATNQDSTTLLPNLVFDVDAWRGGTQGGFFLAQDIADKLFPGGIPYEVIEGRPGQRFNGGRTNKIPGIYLPHKGTAFIVIAQGPLLKVEEPKPDGSGTRPTYRLELVALCNKIVDRETREMVPVKIALKGVPACKLHSYLSLQTPAEKGGMRQALARVTKHYHSLAARKHQAGKITDEQLAAVQAKQATRQMLWAPVPVATEKPLGLGQQTATGCIPYVDKATKGGFLGLWPEAPTEKLVQISEDGTNGYRVPLALQRRAEELAADPERNYEATLLARAQRLTGGTSKNEGENTSEPTSPIPLTQSRSQQGAGTRQFLRADLVARINQLVWQHPHLLNNPQIAPRLQQLEELDISALVALGKDIRLLTQAPPAVAA